MKLHTSEVQAEMKNTFFPSRHDSIKNSTDFDIWFS